MLHELLWESLYTGLPTRILPRDASDEEKLHYENDVIAAQMFKLQQMFAILVTINKLTWLPTHDHTELQTTLQGQLKSMLHESYREYVLTAKSRSRNAAADIGRDFPMFFSQDAAFTAMNAEQYDTLFLTTVYFIQVSDKLNNNLNFSLVSIKYFINLYLIINIFYRISLLRCLITTKCLYVWEFLLHLILKQYAKVSTYFYYILIFFPRYFP